MDSPPSPDAGQQHAHRHQTTTTTTTDSPPSPDVGEEHAPPRLGVLGLPTVQLLEGFFDSPVLRKLDDRPALRCQRHPVRLPPVEPPARRSVFFSKSVLFSSGTGRDPAQSKTVKKKKKNRTAVGRSSSSSSSGGNAPTRSESAKAAIYVGMPHEKLTL